MALKGKFEAAQEREQREQHELGSVRAKLSVITKERDRLIQQLGLIESFDGAAPTPPRWLAPSKKKSADHRATLCLLVTDTHFDETVDPSEIDGINAYNREIAELRLRRCFERAIMLGRDYLGGVKYDGVALFLGGDIFSGNIHEELARTNRDTLFGSLLHWIGPMVAGVNMLAEEFGRVHVSGVPGNHGRSTRKPIAKKRASDNLDWLLYRLMARELSKDPRITWEIAKGADAHVQVYNCVSPETRILTRDLRWVEAGSLKPGQGVLGFDENKSADGSGRGRTRRWREAAVLSTGIDVRKTVRVVLESGQEIVCTPDHRWLCGTSYGFANRWVRADEIRPGWSLRRWFTPWQENRTWGAGWLAGMVDGEGSIGRHSQHGTLVSPDGRAAVQPSISQNEGVVAERLREWLTAFGFQYTEDRSRPCRRFILRGGFSEAARLFGTVRPERLLALWQEFIREQSPHMQAIGNGRVVRVEPAGRREVVVMGTDTETYIAEGFGSHNTRYLLTHGDQFRGGSGISGALAPLMLGTHRKTRRQAAAGRPYDLMVMGHWHQSIFLPSRGLLVGGCLKGYDEYAYISNFEPDEAQQALWITTPERGITFSAPIFVQDRVREGW